MPVHDWTRVDPGLFHDFHQSWTVALRSALNTGALPPDYFALIEPRPRGPMQDGLTLKANRLTVRSRQMDLVAVIEIVSPGNKGSRSEFRTLVAKCAELIRRGVHLLVIDLFPPGLRDPQGIHKAVWDEFAEADFALPPDKPLTLAAYAPEPAQTAAYLECIAVGDVQPDMPLFLKPEYYVPAPLEVTYQAAWAGFPAALKGLLEGPTPPQMR
jgi:hypothetical protein